MSLGLKHFARCNSKFEWVEVVRTLEKEMVKNMFSEIVLSFFSGRYSCAAVATESEIF